MWQRKVRRCSFRESINALEADIRHANTLVAALPKDITGDSVEMKLSFSPFAPFLLFVLEWMDFSCFETFLSCLGLFHVLVYRVYVDGMPIASPEERRATLGEFYGRKYSLCPILGRASFLSFSSMAAVIFPMLKQIEGNVVGLMEETLKRRQDSEVEEKKMGSGDGEREEEDECGICMEMQCKVVLPICGHSMCVGCFNEWYIRSRSCPFCRGSLKRVRCDDVWVLTSRCEVVDAMTLAKDNLRCFYLYLENLPLLASDDSLLMYNYLM